MGAGKAVSIRITASRHLSGKVGKIMMITMSGRVLGIVLFIIKHCNCCGIPMKLLLSFGISRYTARERKSENCSFMRRHVDGRSS